MKNETVVPEITVEELQALMNGARKNFVLLDVREEDEFQIASIRESILVPLSRISNEGLAALPDPVHTSPKIIVQCHHGGRSAQVVQWLLQNGFTDVYNLDGGIDAWSRKIDSNVCRY